jgi:hypothetical protein
MGEIPAPEDAGVPGGTGGEHLPAVWSDRWVLASEAFDRFWAEYSYLFMDGKWLCFDGGGWTPLPT